MYLDFFRFDNWANWFTENTLFRHTRTRTHKQAYSPDGHDSGVACKQNNVFKNRFEWALMREV